MRIGPLRIATWGAPSLWRYRGYAISWVSRRRVVSFELTLERRSW